MKLKQITIENFRAIEQLSFPLGERLTLLLGENGSGKTSIIDAISVGLGAAVTYMPNVSGISFKKTDLRSVNEQNAPYVRIELETTQSIRWDRMLKRDQTRVTAQLVPKSIGQKQLEIYLDELIINRYHHQQDFQLPLFVSYGVGRALLNPPLTRKGFPKSHTRFEALASAFNSNSRFKSAFIWFYNKEHEELRLQKEHRNFDLTLPELDVVRRAIRSMFPDLTEPHIEVNPLQFVVKQNGQFLNIEQLSDGYKTLLGLVIDLSSRMAMANPDSVNPLSEEAIVMIDEVDLHLHPAWQKRVVGDLLRTFENTQFILTTHSPYIVESINNSLKKGKIEHLIDPDVSNQAIKNVFSLSVKEKQLQAYFVSQGNATNIVDQEVGLLDNKLIAQWNEINALYDVMRDIEWDGLHG
jgi:predicted ATP-binding protein involved in virulence